MPPTSALREPPAGLLLQRFDSPHFQASRLSSEAQRFGALLPPPVDEAYMLALTLRPLPSCRMTVGGQQLRTGPIQEGAMCLMRSDTEICLELEQPFDLLRFYIRDDALRDSLHGHARVRALAPPPHGTLDTTANNLMRCLLPALAHPRTASLLFASQVGLALSIHLATTYGRGTGGVREGRGRMAHWQEMRAKEILAADLRGAMSIADLAAECGLSPAYFATAFRRSTGCSPTAWLMGQRIARAKGLLATGEAPLADVALACGFLDQAHFTRHFSRLVGTPPGAWRRAMGQRGAADA